MHRESYEEMARLVHTYLKPGGRYRILDVGSRDVNGTYRPLFESANWTYKGADLEPGPNVDIVLANPYRWSIGDCSYDVVTSGQTFEHVPLFWLTWKEMVRVVKHGGYLFVIVPSCGKEHRHPVDCWRFYRDAMRALGELEKVDVLEAETRWENPWGDTIGVFRKPSIWKHPLNAIGRTGGFWKRFLGLVRRNGKASRGPLVHEEAYRSICDMSIADWLLYHQTKIVLDQVRWMGVKTLKNPLDCWIYQEILWDVRPDIILEIGSFAGGGTLFFCHMLDLLGRGEVVSVDKEREHFVVNHPRLTQISGDCSDPEVYRQIERVCFGKRVLVIHDADHEEASVLRDLRMYSRLVSIGSYFIVEDGIIDVLEIPEARRPGPLSAVRNFLAENPSFIADRSRERYLITYNPCGFLKRTEV